MNKTQRWLKGGGMRWRNSDLEAALVARQEVDKTSKDKDAALSAAK